MPAIKQFPHCDSRVLHAPGKCVFCDKHPEWQELRVVWGINFTGEEEITKMQCPADRARGDNHKLWGGNVAKTQADLDADKVKFEKAMILVEKAFAKTDAETSLSEALNFKEIIDDGLSDIVFKESANIGKSK